MRSAVHRPHDVCFTSFAMSISRLTTPPPCAKSRRSRFQEKTPRLPRVCKNYLIFPGLHCSEEISITSRESRSRLLVLFGSSPSRSGHRSSVAQLAGRRERCGVSSGKAGERHESNRIHFQSFAQRMQESYPNDSAAIATHRQSYTVLYHVLHRARCMASTKMDRHHLS